MKKFYLLQDKIITGPFERQIIINMLNSGKLRSDDMLSLDKVSWQPPETLLELFILTNAEIKKNDFPDLPPDEQPENPELAPPVDFQTDEETGDVLQPENFQQDLSYGNILLIVTASLGNGSGYLQKLNEYNGKTMLTAAGMAAVAGLCFGITGCLLFGKCYNVSLQLLSIHCLSAILLCGLIFWSCNMLIHLFTSSEEKQKNTAEADFLSAMHGMMNTGVISIILNGSFFVFNSRLFVLTELQIFIILAAALLPLIFFSGNIIFSLRMNLMGNCQIRPGLASFLAVLELYAAAILSAALLYTIYTLS